MSCRYCDVQGAIDLEPDSDDLILRVDGTTSELQVELWPTLLGETYRYMARAPIGFCPMCGERLRGEDE